jgi:TIM-barrel protein
VEPFEPRLALASLSGEADAEWARAADAYAGLAVLGGIALDEPTREAARESVADRDRTEFLPHDPFAFLGAELDRAADADLRLGFNVRAVSSEPIERAARICAERDVVLEINAHCRQTEMCAAGGGESLLRETERLCEQVRAARAAGATVSVKLRAEVAGVDLVETARALDAAGADALHVDAMDSEGVVGEIADATDRFLIANNGVRGRESVREYLEYGADAVSVGRPSDDPDVLARVGRAVEGWFA